MPVDATALRQQLTSSALPIVDSAGHALERDIAGSAPVVTGEFSQSGQVDSSDFGTGARATVTFTAEHASFLDEGTGPHRIEGNPLLAFDVGGQTIVVRSVNHPGSVKHKGIISDRTTEIGEQLLQQATEEVLR